MAIQIICQQFARSGICNFRNCRFRHDENTRTVQESQKHPHRKVAATPTSEKDFREWKNAANRAYSTHCRLNTRDSFFSGARKLIECEAGVMQDVLRYLAAEHGLWHIQELVENDFQSMRSESRHALFQEQMIPFLETISHPKVLASLVAEHSLGTILNFIYGINGTRAANLLDAICITLETTADKEARVQWIEVSLQVFSKIMDINSTAFVQDNLKKQAVRLQYILESWSVGNVINSLQISRRYLDRILHRFETGTMISTPSSDDVVNRREEIITFTPKQEPPGGRHNNDHLDISKIQILPTLEEILSDRAEYLPAQHPSRWHLNGLEGLLDRNFRLLREDMVGPLRDAVYQTINGARELSHRNPGRTIVYTPSRIIKFGFHWIAGFAFQVEFPQISHLSRISPDAREAWWTSSKSLQHGSLVCLTLKDADAIFCRVVENLHQKPCNRTHNKNAKEDPKNISLWKDAQKASITLGLVDCTESNIRSVLEKYNDSRKPFFIVEFPGVLLPSFEPTLRALQSLKKAQNLPFEELLVPPELTEQNSAVPPPLYTLKQGFRFNLRCLTKDDSNFYFTPNQPVDMKSLQQKSILDESQAAAVINSLQRCIGLIQGPPGTGKSYTGIAIVRVLLANRKHRDGDIGPIICVAYTNHALDQLLETLLDKKVTSNIIRIGSQSNSEKLQACNLRCVSKKIPKTKGEKTTQWNLRSELSTCEKQFNALRLMQRTPTPRIPSHLRLYYPTHYTQLFGHSEYDYQNSENRNLNKAIRNWLFSDTKSSTGSRPVHELIHLDLMDMTRVERQALHQRWIDEIREDVRREAIQIISSHTETKDDWDKVFNEIDLRCLSEADVIGVTTSGLARNLNMLQKVQSKVLICEEAGEVLEAHLLTALLPSIEHAILIGDHLQLRPQIQNYDLSRENHNGGSQYSLDVSLFERLIEPISALGSGVPFTALETQRRMHPSIAQLVRDTLYPKLKNAKNVSGYPEIPGMRKRLFWLDHRVPEAEGSAADGSLATTSHWNGHEVDMVTAIVNHLINQGSYQSGDIAVLTPYLCQLHRLKQKLGQYITITLGERDQDQLEKAGFGAKERNGSPIIRLPMLHALRIATIDNFQGEEAKVVVISLVRSNSQNRCGFLRTSNRINVLLSRAQHGMYIVGNAETAGHIPMLAHVLQTLEQDNNLGLALELKCPRHPETPIRVSKPNHFLQFSPEGGCNMRCIKRLSCGHACEQRCHSEILHEAVYCQQPCQRPRNACTHTCRNLCGDPCPVNCKVNIFRKGRTLVCGHLKEELPCWQDQEPSKFNCKQMVKRITPGCGHEISVPCHIDITDPKYKCQTQCGAQLPCGHVCKRRCHTCRKAVTDHGKCQQKCGRNQSTCAHACSSTCHGDDPCSPCSETCDVSCVHSKCTRKCHEPCTPCAEEICPSTCPHSTCTMPCAAPCNHVPCSRRCEQELKCGHRCPSVCGEKCPSEKYCQICGSKSIKNHVVDFILGQAYKEVELNDNPCIFPKCGHFLTIENMDAQMELKKHYDINNEEKPAAIKSSPQPFSMEDVKTCALCRGSLRDISRYGRLVRRALLDESTKKFILYLNREYLPLAEDMTKQSSHLQNEPLNCGKMPSWPATIEIKGSSNIQLRTMKDLIGKVATTRWGEILRLRERIQKYLHNVSPSQQPLIRVLDLVENARRRQKITSHSGWQNTVQTPSDVLQTKGVLLGIFLQLRLDITLLIDLLRLKRQAVSQKGVIMITFDLEESRQECHTLINTASESNRPYQQAEGYIYLAQLHALERSHCCSPNDNEKHLLEGQAAIQEARSILSLFPGQTRDLSLDIEGTQKMVNESTFYTIITNEERLSVIQAMAREFQGTGHWYYCANGHPFTVGECGGPMQQSTCPECGAPVGGLHHQAAEGVNPAEDLEAAATRLES